MGLQHAEHRTTLPSLRRLERCVPHFYFFRLQSVSNQVGAPVFGARLGKPRQTAKEIRGADRRSVRGTGGSKLIEGYGRNRFLERIGQDAFRTVVPAGLQRFRIESHSNLPQQVSSGVVGPFRPIGHGFRRWL